MAKYRCIEDCYIDKLYEADEVYEAADLNASGIHVEDPNAPFADHFREIPAEPEPPTAMPRAYLPYLCIKGCYRGRLYEEGTLYRIRPQDAPVEFFESLPSALDIDVVLVDTMDEDALHWYLMYYQADKPDWHNVRRLRRRLKRVAGLVNGRVSDDEDDSGTSGFDCESIDGMTKAAICDYLDLFGVDYDGHALKSELAGLLRSAAGCTDE